MDKDGQVEDDGSALVNCGVEPAINICAMWDNIRENGSATCRYFIAYKKDGDYLVGVVAGYSGGGCFIMEDFEAKVENDQLVSLKIDMDDKVTGEDIDFWDDVSEEHLEICSELSDAALWQWNDEDAWEDAEQIFLKPTGHQDRGLLVEDGDTIIYHQEGLAPVVAEICELAGLTARPH